MTLNKLNKDYNNKFALNISCSFGDIIHCALTFLVLFKDDIAKIYYKKLLFATLFLAKFAKLSDENIQTWIVNSLM